MTLISVILIKTQIELLYKTFTNYFEYCSTVYKTSHILRAFVRLRASSPTDTIINIRSAYG